MRPGRRAVTSCELLLVRHAQSTWNAAGRWQGQGDPPLSELGRAQAKQLAERLRGEKIDALVSSDLARAAQTAAILGEALGLEPCFDARLRELELGHWTGLPKAEIAARWPDELARFRAGDLAYRAGGGESRDELAARAHRAAADLAAGHAGQRVLVVTHLGVIRALAAGAEPSNAELLRVRWPAD